MNRRVPFLFWPALVSIIFAACSAGMTDAAKPGDADYVPAGWTAPALTYAAADYLPAAVIDYRQAPGVSVASSSFHIEGNTDKLLDFPDGGGTVTPDIGSLVSLGMAGGYVTLEFDPPLENYENAADFIVYGNAYYSGGSTKVWQEPGTVWVMADSNVNGQPDDTWYLLAPKYKDAAGDDWTTLVDSSTVLSTVTYTKTDAEIACGSEAYSLSWWPSDAADSTTLTFENVLLLPDSLYAYVDSSPILRGLADAAPTLKRGDLSGTGALNLSGEADNTTDGADDYPSIDPENFYTVPDTVGDRDVDAGSGGGAAMDIGWAVDPSNGFEPVDLSGASVRWVKIVSGTTLKSGAYGDYSCEVDSVVRARAP